MHYVASPTYLANQKLALYTKIMHAIYHNITQHGKGVAVLLDINEYESMLERVELLEDIQMSENQIEKGNGIEHEKAKAQVLKKIVKG